MIRTLLRYGGLAGVVALGACDLPVKNPNQPATQEVLATPNDAEALLAAYYKRWHDGIWRNLGNVRGMANVQSFENYSSLANNCQNSRAPIPRPGNDNSIGNTCSGEQQRVYFVENEVARVASNLLARAEDPQFVLGSRAQLLRFKAFGEFLRGVSLGYLALFYDSSAVISQNMSANAADCLPDPLSGACVGALRPYTEVMDSALVALQRSIDTASLAAASATGGFPLPATWIPSTTTFTSAEFIRLVRSYKARFRANVARTPAERAAVDWTQVIADAQAGITADHDNITNTTTGPFNTWVAQYDTYGLWHQMPPFYIGMADNSGSYATYIATPLGQRGSSGAFFMTTPDLRFPQGGTRAAQQADFAITSCQASGTVCKRYFVNRPAGGDQNVGDGWGWSNYDFVRWHSWRVSGDANSGQNGKLVFMTRAEIRLLEAEGQYRLNNFAAAVPLVNVTRTANGLPAITAANATTPVPGGADCVPKVPVGPAFNTVACGNLLEAIKYEKRIETAYTGFGQWFLDARGWGDLAEGTPLFWAVPYQDLQVRTAPIYGTGVGAGTAANSAAPKGTYGW